MTRPSVCDWAQNIPSRFTDVSVRFPFNASANSLHPASPILLTVHAVWQCGGGSGNTADRLMIPVQCFKGMCVSGSQGRSPDCNGPGTAAQDWGWGGRSLGHGLP